MPLLEKETQNDQDIELESSEPDIDVVKFKFTQNSPFLMLSEIVMLAKCWVKCLARYLPKDIISLINDDLHYYEMFVRNHKQ